MILDRKHRVPISIGQRESVLEITSDILSLERGILDIACLHLLVERTVWELSDILSLDICTVREVLRDGTEDQHNANDEQDKLQSLPAIIAWTPAITAVAAIVGALPSRRALIIGVALV